MNSKELPHKKYISRQKIWDNLGIILMRMNEVVLCLGALILEVVS